MTAYQNKRFSVPQSGRAPEACSHGWIVKGRCWYCGTEADYGAQLIAALEEAVAHNRSTPSPPEPSE